VVERRDGQYKERLPSGPAQVSEKQRTRKPGAKRKVLKNTIKASNARCFQELFGSAYRMVMGKLNRQPTSTDHVQLGQMVSSSTPSRPLLGKLPGKAIPFLPAKPQKTNIAKAPGPDGIPNAALHTLVANYPGIFTEMYNT